MGAADGKQGRGGAILPGKLSKTERSCGSSRSWQCIKRGRGQINHLAADWTEFKCTDPAHAITQSRLGPEVEQVTNQEPRCPIVASSDAGEMQQWSHPITVDDLN